MRLSTSKPAAVNVHITFDRRLETLDCVEDLALKKFALVGVAGLEYWIVVQEMGEFFFTGDNQVLEVKKLAAMISMKNVEKTSRDTDLVYYQRMYFEQKLKEDAHARFAAETAAWKSAGSIPDLKPHWLEILKAVAKVHWQRETPAFREQVQQENEAAYQQRVEEVKKAKEAAQGKVGPRSPEEYEAYVLYDVRALCPDISLGLLRRLALS